MLNKVETIEKDMKGENIPPETAVVIRWKK